jgi:IS5 family transposase
MPKVLKKMKGCTGRVMRDLHRQLNDILGVTLRDQIIAKLALVSQMLHQRPKGEQQDLCHARALGELHL